MSFSFIFMVIYRMETQLDYGIDLLRRRKTITPNFKNFKNLKFANDFEKVYNKGRKLGNGAYGEVFEVENKFTNKKYAMKLMLKSKIKDE